MIPTAELRATAASRLQDARALLAAGRPDAAVYLAGYAVEMALKARICDTLNWPKGFPETRAEFAGLMTFKIHDLEMLLHLTGRELIRKQTHFREWSAVEAWDPEARYKPAGGIKPEKARAFLEAVQSLVQAI